VCDALGGELKFSARPDGGTIVTIKLPVWLAVSK
jgi:signal transduction histidine kinase